MRRPVHPRLYRLIPLLWLIPSLASLGIAFLCLRQNNLEALRLRDVVLQADKDNGDVESALQELRTYMGEHMNTGLANGPNAVHPPIQLKYTYERLSAASSATAQSGDVYSEAQAFCEASGSQGFSGKNRLACIEQYVSERSGSANGPKPAIPKNLYQFDFATPQWSPDGAGWSIVGAVVFLLLVPLHYLRRMLKRRRQNRA